MSVIPQTAPTKQPSRAPRRVWRAPTAGTTKLWLIVASALSLGVFSWYFYALKTQPFVGPFSDPLRLFGIIALLLVLLTGCYTLRRRFARGLPGMVRSWLWMHTWVGLAALFIALLHENFTHILHDYCQNATCFTQAYGGTSALCALIFLVVSGLLGRLTDRWQARLVAHEADTNGAGITLAAEERLLELEYLIERLCAGRSEPFKAYVLQAMGTGRAPAEPPRLPQSERDDFQRADAALKDHTRLRASLQRLRRANQLFRAWRLVHGVLAGIAVVIILFHGGMELLTNVFHF